MRRLRRLRRLVWGVRFTVASVASVALCGHFIRLDYHRDVCQADAAAFVFGLELVLYLMLVQQAASVHVQVARQAIYRHTRVYRPRQLARAALPLSGADA